MKLIGRDPNNDQKQLIKILQNENRLCRVLDVGCGVGRNLDFLTSIGFKNICGVDINPSLVAANVARGFECLLPKDIGERKFDLIVISHVVEHFDHLSLLDFLSEYIQKLNANGKLLIITPLPTRIFYNDFDHVRPYLPIGFDMVYGYRLAQIQWQSKHLMELEDIRFYKLPYRLQFYRRFFVKNANSIPLWVNRFLRVLYFASRGWIGEKSGWIGLYRYLGERR